MAVQIFSGLGQWWHAEGTLFNSNRSCGAEQFDNNLPQQCFFHVGRRPKQSRHTTTHLEHRGEQATVSGQSLEPTTVPWARAIFGPIFVHVAHNSPGNCWRDTQTLGWRHGGLASMAFSWTNFRIEKSPAQVTMLHAGIFLETREAAIPLLSMMTTATTFCLWCDARCTLLPLCQSTGMSPSWMSAFEISWPALIAPYSAAEALKPRKLFFWHPEHGQLRWMDTFQRSISWWMHRCFWCFHSNFFAEPELCRDMWLIPSPSLGIWLVRRVTPATAVCSWCKVRFNFAPVNRHVPEDVCLSLMACTEHGRLPSLDTPEN